MADNAHVRQPIVIVGGGPVGATLALLLGQQQQPVTVLEAREKGAAYGEPRALALSYGSRQLLARLGVWERINNPTVIRDIHVSQKGSFGRSILKAEDYQQEALGYVVSYGQLTQALDEVLAGFPSVRVEYQASAQSIEQGAVVSTVQYEQGAHLKTKQSPLIVLADGGRSLDDIDGLEKDMQAYGHDALIAKVSAEEPHNGIAYERFTKQGPIALLPNGERDFSLVWTGAEEYIAPILNLSDEAFLGAFHQAFGDRVGQFLSVTKRMKFPLIKAQLRGKAQHLVVIGNAAQTMHPVAGQGFNVGLRDAEALAKAVVAAEHPLGSEAMLAAYRKTRQRDTENGLKFTDFLVRFFSNDWLGLHPVRGAGLGLLDIVKPAKAHLVRKMTYGR